MNQTYMYRCCLACIIIQVLFVIFSNRLHYDKVIIESCMKMNFIYKRFKKYFIKIVNSYVPKEWNNGMSRTVHEFNHLDEDTKKELLLDKSTTISTALGLSETYLIQLSDISTKLRNYEHFSSSVYVQNDVSAYDWLTYFAYRILWIAKCVLSIVLAVHMFRFIHPVMNICFLLVLAALELIIFLDGKSHNARVFQVMSAAAIVVYLIYMTAVVSYFM